MKTNGLKKKELMVELELDEFHLDAGKCKNCEHDLIIKKYWGDIPDELGHRKGPTNKKIKHCFCGCANPVPSNAQKRF